MNLVRATLLVLAAALAACERVEVTSQQTEPKNNSFSGSPAGATLVDRIAAARDHTRFQGVRRVEFFYDEGPNQRHLLLRERVSADGQGAFAIEALEVVEPALSSSQHALFLTLQSVRQGLNWRYRDFAIHDLPLFLQNYVTTDTGSTANVAGRACRVLSVERADQSGSIYTLCVDEPTGLLLDVREQSQEGVLVAQSTYESLDLAPDLSAVVWHQRANNEQVLPPRGSLVSYLGFEARAPRLLPAGYRLLERASVLHPQDGGTWVKETFGDGVESLFFLHGGPIVAGSGIRSGSPEIQADLVEVASAAPWTVAQGNLRSERVIALGKIGEADLLSMLRSAME
jgi:hypothetical protein